MSLRLYGAVVTGQPAYAKSNPDLLDGLQNSRHRLTILENAVREAYAAIKVHESKHKPPGGAAVQRVFLAPEYYFSRNRYGDERFFNHDLKRWIVGRMSALAKSCPEMLIVPGTVLWSKELWQKPSTASDPRSAIEMAVKNLARTQQFQTNAEQSKSMGTKSGARDWNYTEGAKRTYGVNPLTNTKQLNPLMAMKAGTQLVRNTAYVFLGDRVLKYHKVGNYQEVKGEQKALVFSSGGVQGVFTVGGIRYGLEICMDHSQGVLKSPVDVHLIVSSYVDFKKSAAPVVLHASTQPAGPVTFADGSTGVAETDPVRFDTAAAKPVDTLALKSCNVFIIDVPSLSPSGASSLQSANLSEVKHVHDPDQIEKRI